MTLNCNPACLVSVFSEMSVLSCYPSKITPYPCTGAAPLTPYGSQGYSVSQPQPRRAPEGGKRQGRGGTCRTSRERRGLVVTRATTPPPRAARSAAASGAGGHRRPCIHPGEVDAATPSELRQEGAAAQAPGCARAPHG